MAAATKKLGGKIKFNKLKKKLPKSFTNPGA
jgi:hypothetical protein